MKPIILYSIIAVLILALAYTNYSDSFEPTDFSDTIVVVKPFIPKTIKKQTMPELVIIYPTDTNLRKQIETQTNILGIEKKKSTLTIAKIDTKGLITETKYDLPIFSSYVVDTAGKVKIKRRFWPYIAVGTSVVVLSFFGIKKIIEK